MTDKPEQFQLKWKAVAVVMIMVCASVLMTAYAMGSGSGGNSIPVVIESGSGVETASYIIYKDGDYNCLKNGTTGRIIARSANATDAIQQGIDAANINGGGAVLIREGEYNITYSIFAKSYVDIYGTSGTTLKAMDSLNLPVINSTEGELLHDVTISGIEIDGNRLNQDAANEWAIGIFLYSPNNCTIDGVYVHDTSKECISTGDSSLFNFRVINSKFVNATAAHGAGTTSTHVWLNPGNYAWVENCYFENATDNAVGVTADHVTISGNYFHDVFVVALSNGAGQDIRISHNTISGNRPVLFYAYDTGGSTVVENIMIDNNVVVNPTAYYSSAVIYSTATVKNFTAMNNVYNNDEIIENNIYIKKGVGVSIQNERMYNNKQLGGASVIRLENVQNAQIIGCEIHNPNPAGTAFTYGILIKSATDGVYADNIIVANNLVVDDRAVHKMYVGIAVNNALRAKNVVVEGNIVSGATNKQLDLDLTVSGLKIDNNVGYVNKASGSAIVLAGGIDVTVTHGLSSTPRSIIVVGSNQYTLDLYVKNVGATTFAIHCYGGATGNCTVYWYAEV